MARDVNTIEDADGNKIVIINDIRFKGKRAIKWNEVKEYLKDFVKKYYVIDETNDIIHIGTDFPDEYTGSKYTYTLKGANAKAKANAAQGIPELIEIARNRKHQANDESIRYFEYKKRNEQPAWL